MMRILIGRLVACAFMTSLVAAHARADPDITANARLDVMISPDGNTIEALRHLWRFDEHSTEALIADYDTDGDKNLDDAELQQLRDATYKTMAGFNFFQILTADGKDVPLNTPQQFGTLLQDGQLILLFEIRPTTPLALQGTIGVGIYDPTFSTTIEFARDEDMAISTPLAGCQSRVVRPDPDEVIAQNQKHMDDAFLNDPAGNDMTRMFATRLEITCEKEPG